MRRPRHYVIRLLIRLSGRLLSINAYIFVTGYIGTLYLVEGFHCHIYLLCESALLKMFSRSEVNCKIIS